MTLLSLNPGDRDVNVELSEENTVAATIQGAGTEDLWGGTRATVGATKGKFYFKVRILKLRPASEPNLSTKQVLEKLEAQTDANGIKIGISGRTAHLAPLGLAEQSWGYTSNGTLTGADQAQNGDDSEPQPLEDGDEVGCFVEFLDRKVVVSFSKNGEWLGEMFSIPRKTKEGYFPHISLKNAEASMNFSGTRMNGFEAWEDAVGRTGHFVVGPPAKGVYSSCEVLFITGLPASGKSKYASDYAEKGSKRCKVLNTESILEMMQIHGVASHKRALSQRDCRSLKQHAQALVTKLLAEAPKFPFNYVVEHHSLATLEGRQSCLKAFKETGFQCKAVALVQTTGEQARCQKGVTLSGAYTLDEYMAAQAIYTLPQKHEGFSEVLYPSEAMMSAERIIFAAKKEGREHQKTPRSGARPRKELQGGPPSKRAKTAEKSSGSNLRRNSRPTDFRGQTNGRNPVYSNNNDLYRNATGPQLAGLKPGYVSQDGRGQLSDTLVMQHQQFSQQGPQLLGHGAHDDHTLQAIRASVLGLPGPPGFQQASNPVASGKALSHRPEGHIQGFAGPPGFEGLSTEQQDPALWNEPGHDPAMQAHPDNPMARNGQYAQVRQQPHAEMIRPKNAHQAQISGWHPGQGVEGPYEDRFPSSEQRRLQAWQRGKEDRLGYMSPALPGHTSSLSTRHQQALQMRAGHSAQDMQLPVLRSDHLLSEHMEGSNAVDNSQPFANPHENNLPSVHGPANRAHSVHPSVAGLHARADGQENALGDIPGPQHVVQEQPFQPPLPPENWFSQMQMNIQPSSKGRERTNQSQPKKGLVASTDTQPGPNLAQGMVPTHKVHQKPSQDKIKNSHGQSMQAQDPAALQQHASHQANHALAKNPEAQAAQDDTQWVEAAVYGSSTIQPSYHTSAQQGRYDPYNYAAYPHPGFDRFLHEEWQHPQLAHRIPPGSLSHRAHGQNHRYPPAWEHQGGRPPWA